MEFHNLPRMLDELLALNPWHREYRAGCVIVYPGDAANRHELFKLSDYAVSSAISAGGYVLIPRLSPLPG